MASKKYDINLIKAELEDGLDRGQVAAKLGIPRSSLDRYIRDNGIQTAPYVQSVETRQKRGEALKKAHELDPSLTSRNVTGFMKWKEFSAGKTWDELYAPDKVAQLKKQAHYATLGRKHSEEVKQKIREGNTGKKLSEEAKRQISEKRKAAFKNGTLRLASRVGVGKGGYREDIGHYVRSTYEHYYAQQLKAQDIAYFYEPRTFEVEVDGQKTSFTPDFYLISEGKWIEIKNAFNATNAVFLKKLAAFQSLYPTEKIEVIVGTRDWIPDRA